ncbi:glycine zipper 2TM domain-containing protein [Lysobacter niastensis]|uniref:Glycine zipper 2TM domain-containing protein n=1 Tax=Lysobacter niastensis TaxID=380629 RepID=A0ABS0BC54_9GAMM|nr:glycine zipper 2TM domain-containing protein [Lysobacter niastensis]MBF6024705.1 glycine zipper 2TM domain-containing protein [Lysobacter niastensis]
MNKNLLAVALASLLVGGVAVAAFNSFKSNDNPQAAGTASDAQLAGQGGDVAANGAIQGVEYADVVNVKPITEKEPQYAQVIGTEPVRETSTTSTPREVCQDVVVQERAPERDGNVGGTVAGAVIGGLVGNQIGDGNGRKAATAAGAVAGGFIGNQVDKRHVGGKVVNRTERQCHTTTSTSQSSKVVAYNVTYRNPDGTTGTMRVGSKPGNRIPLGDDEKVVGYDVTYRYQGQEQTVRMDERPEGNRLPVIDGQVVTQTASASSGTSRG